MGCVQPSSSGPDSAPPSPSPIQLNILTLQADWREADPGKVLSVAGKRDSNNSELCLRHVRVKVCLSGRLLAVCSTFVRMSHSGSITLAPATDGKAPGCIHLQKQCDWKRA